MNNQLEENYGARIKELRIQMGLTQNQVAEELNVTPGYISNVENNRTAMSLRVLTYYAKLVGISLDSLIGQVEQEYQTTALDNDLISKISKMSIDKKLKLLKTLELWEEYLTKHNVLPLRVHQGDFVNFLLFYFVYYGAKKSFHTISP